MADQERRTTTNPTPTRPGTPTNAGTTSKRGMSSTIWIVLGAVLAVIVVVYLFSGSPDPAVEGDGVVDGALEGVEDPAIAPDGTDAEVVPPAEVPAEAPAN